MVKFSTPEALRQACRSGKYKEPTSGECPGYLQENLVILPETFAFSFMLFCHRNAQACPLIEVTDPGNPVPGSTPSADLRTDLPMYRVYKNGQLELETVTDIQEHWRTDLVAFLTGCSFSFEARKESLGLKHIARENTYVILCRILEALMKGGVPLRHVEEGVNVPMYMTNRQCNPAGPFKGPLVVSMRPMTCEQAIKAVQITSRYPKAHGAPIHIGNPAGLGIVDIDAPDFGDKVTIHSGEVPVFWCCGVTSHLAVMNANLPLAITHSPGHMFVTDLTSD